MRRILGLAMIAVGGAVNCLACVSPSAPEIDPTSIGAAVTLLAGGLLVIQYRRKK
jgi:hypothetical protein